MFSLSFVHFYRITENFQSDVPQMLQATRLHKSEQYALVQENLQQQIDDEEENQKAIEEQAEYQKRCS